MQATLNNIEFKKMLPLTTEGLSHGNTVNYVKPVKKNFTRKIKYIKN